MKLKRLLWAIPALLLLIAVFLLSRETGPETDILPDGTAVSLIAVGYDRTNTVFYGSSWQKFLDRVLPAKFKGNSGINTVTINLSRTNSPAFVARLYNPNGIQSKNLNTKVFDEYGLEYDSNGGGWGDSLLKGNTDHIRFWFCSLYGPHSRIAGLRLYDDSQKHLTDLVIPGIPVKSRPMTNLYQQLRQSEKVSAILTSFSTGWQSVADPDGRKVSPQFSQVTFKLLTDAGSLTRGYPVEFQISTNGTAFASVERSSGIIGNEMAINFRGRVDPTNSCRMRFRLIRYDGFSKNELCTFKDIPFPAAGEVSTTNISAQVDGATLTLKNLSGTGTSDVFKDQASATVWLSLPQEQMNISLYEATDEKGKPVAFDRANASCGGEEPVSFWFQPGVRAHKVNLTFAARKVDFFEFEAQPTLISESAKAAY